MNKSMTLTVMKLRSNMLFSIQVSCANQWRRQDFSLEGRIEAPRGWGAGRGCPPPSRGRGLGRGCALPQKIFDYLILKWHILMHISGILTYLF